MLCVIIVCLLLSKVLENMWPFKVVSSFGNKQKSCGEMLCEGRHRIFLSKNSRTARSSWQKCYLDGRYNLQTKVQFSFEERPPATI